MEPTSLDHYEQQLRKVFDKHDHDSEGSLDKDGLLQLFQTLQLEEQGSQLIKVLLTDRKTPRATFEEFRNALLNLLDNIQQSNNRDDLPPTDESPEREVSPKYVYGSKKYGRRSRPKYDSPGQDQTDFKPISVTVQRSNSQTDATYSKKRKTNVRLKRCTSVPTTNGCSNGECKNKQPELICNEDMLREAWRKLGVGEDGYLNQSELILVCDAVGLKKLADSVIRQLSSKFVLDVNRKISFQELLEVLQQDETWIGLLEQRNDSNYGCLTDAEFEDDLDTSFPSSKVLQHIRLGMDGSGYITSDVIAELWEQAGIVSPKQLLADLGFGDKQISVKDLSTVVEKEIRNISEFRIDHRRSTHVALLHAFLSLYQMELKCLRNVLEQMRVEREKLKSDIYEANKQATFLAQEVDETVAKMDQNAQQDLKLLQQKHGDALKELTEQFAKDKDLFGQTNQELEQKIAHLEADEHKLRADLHNANRYSNTLETENNELNAKIANLEQAVVLLRRQIGELADDKAKTNDVETENRNRLLAKFSRLQTENSELRDKHDELLARIETLKSENVALRQEHSVPVVSFCEETLGDGVPIAFESIGMESETLKEEEILETDPRNSRLGKSRKFKNEKNIFQPVLDNADSLSLDVVEMNCKQISMDEYKIKCNLLQTILKAIKSELDDESEAKHNTSAATNAVLQRDDVTAEFKNEIFEYTKLYESIHLVLKQKLSKLESDKSELLTKCDDLENCMSLLRNEYEKCEDYWHNKLQDERNLFEVEQEQTGRKLNDLIGKLSEYEDQFLKEESGRLPPIDETAFLEKQFTDLESEFADYRTQTEGDLEALGRKIESQQRLLEKETRDVAVQVNNEQRVLNLSNHVIESTNLFSSDALPSNAIESSNLFYSDVLASNHNHNNNNNNNYELHSVWHPDEPHQRNRCVVTVPGVGNSTPVRPKITRRHERLATQQRVQRKSSTSTKSRDTPELLSNASEDTSDVDEPKCCIGLWTLQSLQTKKHYLEQRCRKLQMVLKHQHLYDEQLFQASWQQRMSEKAELQYFIKYYQDRFENQMRLTTELNERLARNDLLVKDLFVDNAYLMAKNQRLEQQCHMLAQCHSNSI